MICWFNRYTMKVSVQPQLDFFEHIEHRMPVFNTGVFPGLVCFRVYFKISCSR